MGIPEHVALIEFYYGKKPNNVDEYCEYYQKIDFLRETGVIDLKYQ